MEGWIKLHRQLLKSTIWKISTPEQKTVLIALLLTANHCANDWEYKGQPYTCQPGQLVTSVNSIMEACGKGITDKKVRNALDKFVKHGVIEKESSTKNTLITFVNWDKFQKGEINKGQSKGNEEADCGQTGVEQRATNKNVNNYKKENNYKKNTYGVGQKTSSDFAKTKKNKFVNFQGRNYDYAEYERMEFERLSRKAETTSV